MKFLFPGFLFALSTVAIPIIIHLFNFRKFKKVYFSNVRFLKDIQQQTSSSRKLKNLWLLAARMLAIIFLVLAFARPYIPHREQTSVISQQLVSIYIDNSYSMESINREGSLLDEAKRRAKEIASAYGINDRFQILTNDFEGKHQHLLNHDEFINAVDDIKISAVNRNINEVINRIQEVYKAEPNTQKTAYLVSDFQENMLEGSKAKLDTASQFRFVKLQATKQPNISVDSVWFISPVHKAGETEKLVIQLKNNSDKKAENVPYKLTINSQQKAIGSLGINARSYSRDTLSFGGLKPGWQNAEIAITDYPIIFDDKFYFTFSVENQMAILAINAQNNNIYLDAVYRADPFFKLVNVNAGSLNYSSLGSYPLIILNSLAEISQGLAQQLKIYVQNGGCLMVFPALEENLQGLTTLAQALGTDRPEALINQQQKIESINLQHPLFKGVFEQLPRSMDLPVAKKYVRYGINSRVIKQNIMEFPGRRVGIAQYSVGKGKVYLSALPLNEEGGNLVRHSIFVPVMYQVAFLSLRDNRLFYTIGKDQYLESQKITLQPNQTLRLTKGNFEAIPSLLQAETSSRIFIAGQVRQQGIYSLAKGDMLLANYAFNDSRSESNLSYASEDELKNYFKDYKPEFFSPGGESVQEAIKAINNGVQLWKLCLILALVFLAAEILIIKFYKPQNSNQNI